jgi:hypothetical protein
VDDTIDFADPAHHREPGYTVPQRANIQPHIDRLSRMMKQHGLIAEYSYKGDQGQGLATPRERQIPPTLRHKPAARDAGADPASSGISLSSQRLPMG